MRSNMFAAQLKRVCVHHAQVMNSPALKAGFILEAKLLLANQPVHGKCCFTIHPLYICRPIYVGMVLSVVSSYLYKVFLLMNISQCEYYEWKSF